jgi:hypothetical protein
LAWRAVRRYDQPVLLDAQFHGIAESALLNQGLGNADPRELPTRTS